ncbi:MAG: 3-hydroxyacyl-CoA dehydrogenase NAD-binding domain-containing protein [bacterium]|nr:3-hydroxyacyl-CoA dehydrogenase NAD-binding domain-containing protein [bacterium]MDE0499785.1 3-hydroxyacyl-CoA dehydrogenase NAD-binding domain-containing protein [bacterium]MDE0501737.1 3-hydroxyacyl-CoA dehydrogenase NAD-binding domain-containing protein [bacterium]
MMTGPGGSSGQFVSDVGVVGLVGTGVIGKGWAVRALSRGWEVVATDPAPGAAEGLMAFVERAWPAATALGLYPGARPDRVRFVDGIEEVAGRTDLVVESVSEREELKKEVALQIDRALAADVLICSSSSGLLPSRLQAGLRHPERYLVAHPFNPVYILPLVELCGGRLTSPGALAAAKAIYEDLGMHPLVVRNEIEGYLSDRLQEAMWREALWMVSDGVATTDELDQAIIYGPGLRWAGMGTMLTFHLAGGSGGMRHMLEHFGPALELPWTRLKAPPLTERLSESLISGIDEQAAGRSVAELEQLRDGFLISVMRALRPHDLGAGRMVADREAVRLGAAARTWRPGVEVVAPLELYHTQVEPDWVDYNGHMTESAYLTAFGWASDALFRFVGIDEDYRAGGHSFYTVETHIHYRREASVHQELFFTTQVLGVDERRLHIFHAMHDKDGRRLSSTEQMLLHVDTEAGGAVSVLPGPARALAAVEEAHRKLGVPPEVGSRMSLDRGS